MSEEEQRQSPALTQGILLVCFVVFVVIGIFTVVRPELSSDDAETPGPEASSEPADPNPSAEEAEPTE